MEFLYPKYLWALYLMKFNQMLKNILKKLLYLNQIQAKKRRKKFTFIAKE